MDRVGSGGQERGQMASVLTMAGGRVVHAAAEHAALNPPLPPVRPSYSPLLTGANAP
ncbi:hypothetical protein GCM10010349_63850 [Streptomyces flavofungini]|nr:hypothetical protein GCM10010349_63850 [Streptomyces flavofungini]